MQFFILFPAAFNKARYHCTEFKFSLFIVLRFDSRDSSRKECTQMLLFCKVWGKELLTFMVW